MNLHKNLFKFFSRKLLVISLVVIFAALFFNSSFAQQHNDYRTKSSGNWSDVLIWQRYNGDTTNGQSIGWKNASAPPDASWNVITIQFNHSVNLDMTVSVDQLYVGGILTLSAENSLNITNGDLYDLTMAGIVTGPGDINIISGVSAISSGGTLSGTGVINIASGGGYYIAGSVAMNRNVTNNGLCAWSTGSITGTGSFTNNSVFNNETAFGASWGLPFVNNGTFNKTTSNTNFFSASFQTSGTINIQSGGIVFNSGSGGTINGTINISSGGNLQFGNGIFATFTVNAAISGAGTVTGFSTNVTFSNTCSYNITGVTTALSGAMTFTPGMTLTSIGNMSPAGGAINLPSGLTVGAYGTILRVTLGGTLNTSTGKTYFFQKIFSTGTITGSDSIFVSDSLTLSSGSITGTGAITLNSGGQGVIFNNGITLDKTLINNGTIIWSQGSVSGNGKIINNSVLSMTSIANSCGPSFTNNGTFSKGSSLIGNFTNPFNNSSTGIINITNSTLMASNNGSQSIAGSVNISAGATLQLGNTSSGTFNITGSISGAGNFYGHTSNVNFLAGSSYNISGLTGTYSGTLNFNTGMTLTNIGTLNSGGGTINIQSGLTSFSIGTSLTLSGGAVINFNAGRALTFSTITSNGTISGSDTIWLFGSAAFTGGTLSGSGPFNVLTGSVMDLNVSGFTINKVLNNNGTLNWLAGSIFGSGPFNNNHVANFSTSFTPTWNPLIINNGTINKNTSNSPFMAGGFTSTGTINITSGTLMLITNSGTYAFDGVINISSGAGLTIGAGGGGTATQNISAQISGAGNVTLGLPTVNFNSGCIYNITGNTNVIFGSANFNAAMTLTNIGNFSGSGGTTNFASGLTIGSIGSNVSIGPLGVVNFNTGKSYSFNNFDLAGAVAGTDSIFVNNTLTWTNGGIASSAFTLKSGAVCNLNTGNGVYITGKFINNGTFNWIASGITSSGTFINNNIFNINTISTSTFGPLMTNNGTINKTTANINSIGSTMTNNSVININSGGISTAACSNYGTINLSNNTTLSINGLFTSWGAIAVSSNSFVNGNSLLTYNGSSLVNNGNVSVNLQFDSITSVSGSGVFNNNSTFLNGCNVSLASDVQFKNAFINSGAVFNLNGKKLLLNGTSFTNSGTFNMNNSYVEYNANVAQTLTTGLVYKGLIINNPAGVSITGGTVTVDDTLKILSGFLNVGAFTLSLGTTGHLVEGTGAVVKGTTGIITATRTLNTPLSVNIAGLGATITSEANLGSTAISRGFNAYTINGSGSVKRYYNISPTNNSGLNATLTYHYDNSELNGLNENLITLFRSTNAGTNWTIKGGTKDTANNNITFSNIDAFSYWTAANNPLLSSINISVLVDALYNTSTGRLNKKDTVTVYLRNSFAPYLILDSSKILIDSVSFSGTAYFSTTPSGTYYLTLKYRNAIETWTKSGGETYNAGTDMFYDFSSAQSQAYGNNLILKNGKYCLISGDVNQDGFVNGNDFTVFSQQFGLSGYLKSDLNGDNNVNGNDFTTFSSSFGKQTIHP